LKLDQTGLSRRAHEPETTTIRLTKIPGICFAPQYVAEQLLKSESLVIKSNPNRIISQGTDWRFFNELKRELKADFAGGGLSRDNRNDREICMQTGQNRRRDPELRAAKNCMSTVGSLPVSPTGRDV
jgi:hypothetical protein